MFIIILIAVVAVVVIIIAVKSSNNQTSMNNETYDSVIKEVLMQLEILQNFYNRGMDEYCDFVTIIPVDCYGNLYGYGNNKNADRIQVSLLFHERIDSGLLDIINFIADKTDADTLFQLKTMDGNTYYMATTFSRFEGNYKKFMPFLNSAVAERFPELRSKFDGSMISLSYRKGVN